MYDSSELITDFQNEHVSLTQKQQQDMQKRRDVNLERVEGGLEDMEKPAIVDTINQGGNKMGTMTQPPEGNEDSRYDIDMGVVFEEGDAKTPSTTKWWVRDAIARRGKSFATDPEVKKKCVRVTYTEGYQVDFPVFRRKPNGYGGYWYEIAISDEWVASDPAAINTWFEEQVKSKSPKEEDSGLQLRRITRLLKYFSKVHAHRTNRSFPKGIVVTGLAVECYQPVAGRDDESFYKTLSVLKDRSQYSPVYANGVKVSDDRDADRIARVKAAAADAVEALNTLSGNDAGMTLTKAAKAWKKVFRHSFFDEAAEESGGDAKKSDLASPNVFRGLGATEQLRRAEAAVASVVTPTKPWRE